MEGNKETIMERDMESRAPSIIDLNAELAKLNMFRRTPQSTRAETKGSVARLASYRDGLLLAIKSSKALRPWKSCATTGRPSLSRFAPEWSLSFRRVHGTAVILRRARRK